jgi:hypothetical protein
VYHAHDVAELAYMAERLVALQLVALVAAGSCAGPKCDADPTDCARSRPRGSEMGAAG